MAELFGTKRPAITKHLGNIFKVGELEQSSVCSILEHTASDGKIYHRAFKKWTGVTPGLYRQLHGQHL